jgi:putative transposase
MARLPRYFVKGVPLHIILRGNHRDPIFGNDDDYQFFKECLLDEYSWSSYRCNAEGRADALVSLHSYYRGLAREEIERQAAYRILVKGPMDVQTIDTIRTCTNKGWALGGQKFQSKIERLAERRAAPVSKGRPKSITAD